MFGVEKWPLRPRKDKKPDNWVEEKRIVDEKAKKPDDWDDEEDGEWEAPMIDNPEYKGEWTVKRISNPAYKGGGCAKNHERETIGGLSEILILTIFSCSNQQLWNWRPSIFFWGI